MLYQLLYPLRDIFFGFNVFRYITFRAAGAMITAFILSILLGPFIINTLKRFRIGEKVRSQKEVPGIYHFHKHKEGTPTMGGLLMLVAILIATILWGRLDNRYILLTVFSTLWLGIVGLLDDYLKLTKNGEGLSKTTKFTGQVILGLIVGIILFVSS